MPGQPLPPQEQAFFAQGGAPSSSPYRGPRRNFPSASTPIREGPGGWFGASPAAATGGNGYGAGGYGTVGAGGGGGGGRYEAPPHLASPAPQRNQTQQAAPATASWQQQSQTPPLNHGATPVRGASGSRWDTPDTATSPQTARPPYQSATVPSSSPAASRWGAGPSSPSTLKAAPAAQDDGWGTPSPPTTTPAFAPTPQAPQQRHLEPTPTPHQAPVQAPVQPPIPSQPVPQPQPQSQATDDGWGLPVPATAAFPVAPNLEGWGAEPPSALATIPNPAAPIASSPSTFVQSLPPPSLPPSSPAAPIASPIAPIVSPAAATYSSTSAQLSGASKPFVPSSIASPPPQVQSPPPISAGGWGSPAPGSQPQAQQRVNSVEQVPRAPVNGNGVAVSRAPPTPRVDQPNYDRSSTGAKVVPRLTPAELDAKIAAAKAKSEALRVKAEKAAADKAAYEALLKAEEQIRLDREAAARELEELQRLAELEKESRAATQQKEINAQRDVYAQAKLSRVQNRAWDAEKILGEGAEGGGESSSWGRSGGGNYPSASLAPREYSPSLAEREKEKEQKEIVWDRFDGPPPPSATPLVATSSIIDTPPPPQAQASSTGWGTPPSNAVPAATFPASTPLAATSSIANNSYPPSQPAPFTSPVRAAGLPLPAAAVETPVVVRPGPDPSFSAGSTTHSSPVIVNRPESISSTSSPLQAPPRPQPGPDLGWVEVGAGEPVIDESGW